jgi:hypothetical protein
LEKEGSCHSSASEKSLSGHSSASTLYLKGDTAAIILDQNAAEFNCGNIKNLLRNCGKKIPAELWQLHHFSFAELWTLQDSLAERFFSICGIVEKCCRIVVFSHFYDFVFFQGGGIPHKVTSRMFNYLYSTAPRPSLDPSDTAAFAGYGYGLPLSRLYARY